MRSPLLLLLLALALLAAAVAGVDRWRDRESEDSEDAEEVEREESSEEPAVQTNTGYTIKRLFGEENSDPLPRYPRRNPSGQLDNRTMQRFGGVPRPPQKIRLRGDQVDMNPNEGRVEIEHQGSWGLVCDDHFGETEASVTCKSLGFKKGANTQYSGSFFGTGRFRQSDIQMSQVRCSPHGDEKELTQCTHSHGGNCLIDSTAGVECHYNEGCEWGWIGYDGLCYQVKTAPKTPEEAAEDCASSSAKLAYVLSEGENNFISDMMYTKFKNLSAVWTAGQFATVQKRQRTIPAWVFKDSDHVIKEAKSFWFPGFNDGSSARPTTDREMRSCIALTKIFPHRTTGKDTEVNYFWWDNASCKTRLPYICQKLATPTGCYNGTGKGYRGDATRTEDGSLCEFWGSDNPDFISDDSSVSITSSSSSSSYASSESDRFRGLRSRGRFGSGRGRGGSFGRRRSFGGRRFGRPRSAFAERSMSRRVYGYGGWNTDDHNHCRNPDMEKKPWCWIDKKQRTMGYCNLRACNTTRGDQGAAVQGPPKHLTAGFSSSRCPKPEQFFCPSMVNYRPNCVHKRDVCDGFKDCVGGEDENATFCRSYKCKPEEFYCSRSHRCIPTSRVCDKRYDCDHGDDETPEACEKYRPGGDTDEAEILKQYTKSDNVDKSASVTETMSTVSYMTLTMAQCRLKCDRPDPVWPGFSCSGFLFSAQGEYGSECVLLPERLTDVTASEGGQFAYFEKKMTCNSDQFSCKNGHCIPRTQKCNGFDDCGDFSDEIGATTGCPDPRQTFKVRLSGGKGPWEGRVEVRLFKEWGLVCDDSLDMNMGNLICRELNYTMAAERLVPNAKREFGRGSGKFLMSSANCTGSESSLYNCKHPGWMAGNCSLNNIAGVVCARERACTRNEFRCSRRCFPLSSVCDGVRDCAAGGEDEAACDAMTVALRNGNTSSSGVLEVTRGGIPGAVCDDTFSQADAQVACRQLGFADGRRARKLPAHTFEAPENLVVWLQDVRCQGNEATLFKCGTTNWGQTHCDVSEAVNLECDGVAPATTTTTTTAAPPAPDVTAAPSGCGVRSGRFPAGRIVNGYPAISGQFPWQVGIRLRLSSTESQQWCGGTIISDKWIVTASHCFEDYPKSSYILRIGDVDNTVKESFEREFDIDLIVKHENYSGNPLFDYDITLLRVKPDRQGFITFNAAVQPACLPDKDLVAPRGTVCHISGWGSMGTLDLPKNLMAANVPLIENDKCNTMYQNRITDRMQCAGFEAGGIDSCQGDSGGPLVCKIKDLYVLMGATSWGEGCALPGAPGVYANIRNLRDWIDKTIRANP